MSDRINEVVTRLLGDPTVAWRTFRELEGEMSRVTLTLDTHPIRE